MEAPENIWLSPNEYRSNEPSCFWSESQRTDYDIEYIRKDAFIEKAKKQLYLQLNEINMEGEDMENFLKDFKKYMEE